MPIAAMPRDTWDLLNLGETVPVSREQRFHTANRKCHHRNN